MAAKKKKLMEEATKKVKFVMAKLQEPNISEGNKAKLQKILGNLREQLATLNEANKKKHRALPPAEAYEA